MILLLLLLPGVAIANWTRTLTVEWGYTPPSAPAVVGFNLYLENVLVCNFPGKGIVNGSCTVSSPKQIGNFTLTALFSNNSESPMSSVFAFKYPDDASTIPSPVLLRITVK